MPETPLRPDAFRTDPSATASFDALISDLTARDDVHLTTDAAKNPFARLHAVTIGGGTGTPISIRTLLSLGVRTDAVVAMADDGGSTGVIRRNAGTVPPGDIRKCLIAFAKNPHDPLVRALKYRFEFADDHSLGNLLLTALDDVTGSFPEAVAICERLVEAQGHVYPSTVDNIALVGQTVTGKVREGEAACGESPECLRRIRLAVEGGGAVVPYQPAVEAIESADVIVLGPGSLFTSVIPNLLVPGITQAIAAARSRGAATVFICSMSDTQGETKGMSVRDYYNALFRHGMRDMVDYMVIHQNVEGSGAQALSPVPLSSADLDSIQSHGTRVIIGDFAYTQQPTWHEPKAFRDVLAHILDQVLAAKGLG